MVWAAIYFLAVFLEEQWLETVYNEEFAAYMKRVRQFV
jgi:protein-S-isoprenylcysteine O-methyltransferase Ste14